MTIDEMLCGMKFWWEHHWMEREDITFKQWLVEWHRANTPEAAMGLLEIVLRCYSHEDTDAPVRFLFHIIRCNLPCEAQQSVACGSRDPAAVRIQRKAEEVFLLQLIKQPEKRDHLTSPFRWAGMLMRDAANGGTMFADLMSYFVDNYWGRLDDETRHYQSAVKQLLITVNKAYEGMRDELEGFHKLRDANLISFYRALVVYGLADVIESCEEPSLKALGTIAFAPYGFPEKIPADLAEVLIAGDWQAKRAASRLMYLRTLAVGRRREQRRRNLEQRITEIGRELEPKTVETTQTISPVRRRALTRELEKLHKLAAELQAKTPNQED